MKLENLFKTKSRAKDQMAFLQIKLLKNEKSLTEKIRRHTELVSQIHKDSSNFCSLSETLHTDHSEAGSSSSGVHETNFDINPIESHLTELNEQFKVNENLKESLTHRLYLALESQYYQLKVIREISCLTILIPFVEALLSIEQKRREFMDDPEYIQYLKALESIVENGNLILNSREPNTLATPTFKVMNALADLIVALQNIKDPEKVYANQLDQNHPANEINPFAFLKEGINLQELYNELSSLLTLTQDAVHEELELPLQLINFDRPVNLSLDIETTLRDQIKDIYCYRELEAELQEVEAEIQQIQENEYREFGENIEKGFGKDITKINLKAGSSSWDPTTMTPLQDMTGSTRIESELQPSIACIAAGVNAIVKGGAAASAASASTTAPHVAFYQPARKPTAQEQNKLDRFTDSNASL